MSDGAVINTDKEIYRSGPDGYADTVFVTTSGGIGIQSGGRVNVRTPRGWTELSQAHEDAEKLAALVLVMLQHPDALVPVIRAEVERLARKLAPDTVKRPEHEPGKFVPGIHPIDIDENGQAHIGPVAKAYYVSPSFCTCNPSGVDADMPEVCPTCRRPHRL